MSENKDVRELNPDKLEQFSGSGMKTVPVSRIAFIDDVTTEEINGAT